MKSKLQTQNKELEDPPDGGQISEQKSSDEPSESGVETSMSEEKITEATTNATPLDDASGRSVSAEPSVAALTTEMQALNEEKEALEQELQEVIIPYIHVH